MSKNRNRQLKHKNQIHDLIVYSDSNIVIQPTRKGKPWTEYIDPSSDLAISAYREMCRRTRLTTNWDEVINKLQVYRS